MKSVLLGIAVVAGLLLTAWSPAEAENWIQGSASGSYSYYTDVDSISRKGAIVESWMRQSTNTAEFDQKSGKYWATSLSKRYDDCENHKFGWGSYVRRDASGQVIDSGNLAAGWIDALPGSVGDALSKLNCALSQPPAVDPLLPDINSISWTSLGNSADDAYVMYVNFDHVVRVIDGRVLSLSRSDYKTPQLVDGIPVKILIEAAIVDCQNTTTAAFASDFYVTPNTRVKAVRRDAAQLNFQRLAPGSFGFVNLSRICSAATDLKEASKTTPAPGGPERATFSVGTAWVAQKGYLVTASHVVHGGSSIEVYRNGQSVGAADVIADDPANDLAVLKVKRWRGGNLVALPLGHRPASLGRPIFTLGYPEPGVLGTNVKMTSGEISSTSGAGDDARYLQIGVPIQQGNSGGPILSWDGEVLGIVESKLTAFSEKGGPAPEMVNYAIKSSYLRPLLEGLPDLGNYLPLRPHLTGDALIAEARKAVFLVAVKSKE